MGIISNDFGIISQHLIVPCISTLFTLGYTLYFFLTPQFQKKSYLYFRLLLLSFGLFWFFLTIQGLFGSYPVPMIINMVGVFIFLGCVIPFFYLTYSSFYQKKIPSWKIPIFIGIALALVSIIFRFLGSSESKIILELTDLTLYNPSIPAWKEPFYAREFVLVINGLTPVAFLLYAIIKNYKESFIFKKMNFKSKYFIFNIGVIFFILSLAISSITNLWIFFHLAPIFTLLIFTYGIILDINETRCRIEKMIPLIENEIFNDLSFMTKTKRNLMEVFQVTGITPVPDTFMMIHIDIEKSNVLSRITLKEQFCKFIKKELDLILGVNSYLVFQISLDVTSICFKNIDHSPLSATVIGERLLDKINKHFEYNVVLGIGNSYSDLNDLKESCREAFKAERYCSQLDSNMVIHINEIYGDEEVESACLQKIQEQLIETIISAHGKEALSLFDSFFNELLSHTLLDIEEIKLKLIEVSSLIYDRALKYGSPPAAIRGLNKSIINNVLGVSSIEELENYYKTAISKVCEVIKTAPQNQLSLTVISAKKIIQKHYKESITLEEVAKKSNVSISHFKRIFKKETNLTFSQYLIQVRLKKAKQLLQEKGKNIAEIAFESGFNDSAYFSRIFKKHTGTTPREFRENISRFNDC